MIGRFGSGVTGPLTLALSPIRMEERVPVANGVVTLMHLSSPSGPLYFEKQVLWHRVCSGPQWALSGGWLGLFIQRDFDGFAGFFADGFEGGGFDGGIHGAIS